MVGVKINYSNQFVIFGDNFGTYQNRILKFARENFKVTYQKRTVSKNPSKISINDFRNKVYI